MSEEELREMASRPALLTVDDDRGVLRAVARDLRRRYGDDYQVLAASSGGEALQVSEELQRREQPLALMLVDQRMPGMSGIEFVERAKALHPEAKRVLLTAYADTSAAIDGINRAQLDHYIQKPWDPPEERLYPTLDDLLEDWRAAYREPATTVVGLRWSAEAHRIRAFLTLNGIPFRWLDLDSSEEARLLVERDPTAELPFVDVPGKPRLESPENAAIGRALGLLAPPTKEYFDLLVVGGGPAGLAAGVYGRAEGLSTALVECEAPGGQAGQSSRIENYLGFPSGVRGSDFSRRAVDQARRFEVQVLCPARAGALEIDGSVRKLRLDDQTELSFGALIVATGVSYRRMKVPGAERLEGVGVFYGGGVSEAIDLKGEDVHLVGGANSAGQAALYFAQYARTVHVLVRASSLRKSMSSYLADRLEQPGTNIVVHTSTKVVEVLGGEHIEAVTLLDTANDSRSTVPTAGMFVFIGAEPRTEWLGADVARDDRGFILTGPDMRARDGRWSLPRDPFLLETSVPGVFAVGDVRANAIRRVASAVGEGSIAVQFALQYLGSSA